MKVSLKVILSILIILLLGVIAYSNSFNVPFQFDGKEYVYKNPTIRDVGNIGQIWKKDYVHRARFVPFVTFALNYHFHQYNLFGYHLINLLVHLICAGLVGWLTFLTFCTPKLKDTLAANHKYIISIFTAALFVSHPIQTQAITYIVQRFASMAALFYVLTVCLYIKGRLTNKVGWFITAALAAVCGMFSKQIVITLPVMILLYEFLFLTDRNAWKNSNKKFKLAIILPLLIFSLIIPATNSFKTVFSYKHNSDSHKGDRLTSKTYFLTQSRVLPTYMRLLVFPKGQRLDYDFPMSKSIFEVKTALGFLFLLSLFLAALKLSANYRILTLGILWFFLTISVESSLIAIENVIFEHRVYLPSAGFFILVSAGLFYLLKDIRKYTAVLSVIVCILAVCTYQRNKVWQSEISLWKDSAAKSPNKARPVKNLGVAYAEQGDLSTALGYLQKTIKLDDTDPDAYNNLANIYNKMGNKERAIELYQKTIAINPHQRSVYNNLGSAYYDLGQYQRAFKFYKKAVQRDGINPTVYYNLANVYYKLGKKDKAIENNIKALSLSPDYADAYQNLGNIYSDLGKHNQAINAYMKVLELDETYARAHNNLAALYFKLGDFHLAVDHIKQAQKLGYTVNPLFLQALKPYDN